MDRIYGDKTTCKKRRFTDRTFFRLDLSTVFTNHRTKQTQLQNPDLGLVRAKILTTTALKTCFKVPDLSSSLALGWIGNPATTAAK